MERFTNKIALVTGAAGGIGQAMIQTPGPGGGRHRGGGCRHRFCG